MVNGPRERAARSFSVFDAGRDPEACYRRTAGSEGRSGIETKLSRQSRPWELRAGRP